MSETRRSVDIKRFPTLSFPPPQAASDAATTPPAGMMAAERALELATLQEHLGALAQRVQELSRMTHQLRDELRVVQAIKAQPMRGTYSAPTPEHDTVPPLPLSSSSILPPRS